jgi:hypothetical protein
VHAAVVMQLNSFCSISALVAQATSLADNYDYVMHGRVFNIKHIEKQCVEVQASFGGLLVRLRGEQAHVESLAMDMTYVKF